MAMALRFRRTLKIAPGVRLNLTKTGVSARIGPRGTGVTVGTRGTTVSAGIPGTGLHASQKLKANRTQPVQQPIERDPPAPKKLGFLGWLGVGVIIAGIVWLII